VATRAAVVLSEALVDERLRSDGYRVGLCHDRRALFLSFGIVCSHVALDMIRFVKGSTPLIYRLSGSRRSVLCGHVL
jgi:hypothetical protein